MSRAVSADVDMFAVIKNTHLFVAVRLGFCENTKLKRIILTGFLTNLLQKATVSVIDQADCLQSYGNVLTPNMICAGFMEGGKDTCLVRYTM